jgi:hypothetical protein
MQLFDLYFSVQHPILKQDSHAKGVSKNKLRGNYKPQMGIRLKVYIFII